MLNTQALPRLAESPADSDKPDSPRHQPSLRQSSGSPSQSEAALIGLSHGRGRVAALQRFSEPPDDSVNPFTQPEYRYPPSQRAAGDSQMKTFNLTVLERMANSRVCLSWHDPTSCNYEEQVWTPGLARRSGRCALSGAHIRKGDAVHRPQARGSAPPANSDAMILTSALAPVRDG
jgi:hypothetical protein